MIIFISIIIICVLNLTIIPSNNFIIFLLNFTAILLVICYLLISYSIIESTLLILTIYITGLIILLVLFLLV